NIGLRHSTGSTILTKRLPQCSFVLITLLTRLAEFLTRQHLLRLFPFQISLAPPTGQGRQVVRRGHRRRGRRPHGWRNEGRRLIRLLGRFSSLEPQYVHTEHTAGLQGCVEALG